MTLKKCHDWLKEHADTKITRETTLDEIVPTLVECVEQLGWAWKSIRTMRELISRIAAETARFVEEHPQCTDEASASPIGVRTYNKTIGDAVYHLVCGFDGFVREDGETLNQEFLGSLPDGWVKAKLEIDKTGIKRLGVTGEQIRDAGLAQKPTFTWSRAEDF